MQSFVLSVVATILIAVAAAFILTGLGWDSATVYQSSGNVRL